MSVKVIGLLAFLLHFVGEFGIVAKVYGAVWAEVSTAAVPVEPITIVKPFARENIQIF